MNWLTNVVRPKIRNILRRETPENLWIKCPDSGQLVFYKDVEANQFVIPGSNYHMRMGGGGGLKSISDNETWFDVALPGVTADPLKFRDERKYGDRSKDARARTGLNDAIKVGYGKLEGAAAVIAVQDFDFMGGSLGMAAGEAIVRSLELAVEKKSPFIVFAASGGARMQEGILSLMQMPRTTVGVQMLREAKLPYIVVLTNPTTGGVTAPAATPSPLDGLIARLSALHPKRIDLGLERMQRLLEQLDHPERKLPPVIHVAGTNGKGSTIAYLRAILEAAGLRVHAYTSPYLVRVNECFRLGRAGGGVLVGDDELRAALEHFEQANATAPTTILEIETAAAFCLFAEHPADVVLLEVGLGGRLDATNAIDGPLASGIAPVSIDHSEFFSDTLTAIAGEKAGVLKRRGG